ncbi:MAG TPA: PIN domain-containing protein [Thermoanaerobaculia bacterium]
MIVYVETNFLLELAFQQESYESCEEILRLANSASISLVLPACCVAEAYVGWYGITHRRRQFQEELQNHLREMSRSASHRGLVDRHRDVLEALVAGREESRNRLVAAIASIETDGATIPVTALMFAMVARDEEAHSLSPQDGLVLASVKSHARKNDGPKCFVTKDKDFNKPAIREELGAECEVLMNFADAVGYIKNVLRGKAES